MAFGNTLRKTYIDIDANVGGALAGMGAVQAQAFGTTKSMQSVYGAQGAAAASTRGLTTAFYGLAAGAAAATGALYLMVRAGSRVDLLFAEMRATSGATAEQMQRVRNQSKRLGAELPTTLYEAADAFREMSYAGYTAEEAIAASTGVVYLAETAGLDMATAARIATSNLNAFRMEATRANSVANALAGTFATSAVTIEEVGKSLEYASAAAYQAGQSMTQTTAAIGMLGDVGLRASKAGVGMQQFFTRLAAPSGKAEKALQELNLTTQDFIDKEGGFKSLYEIISILGTRLEGVGEAEQIRLLTEIFQTRGMRAVAPLVNNLDKMNEKIEQVGAATVAGAIQSFDTLNDTVKETREQRIDELLEQAGAAEDMQFEIGANISLEQYVDQLQELRGTMSEEELTQLISASLEIEEDAARILAGDIARGESTEDLVRGLEQATTAGEITAAKIDTVAGQMEYLAGSISAFAYTAYRQIEPLFYAISHALTTFADLMNEYTIVAQTFGVAILALAAALGTATVYTGAYVAALKLQTAAQSGNLLVTNLMTTALYAKAAATWAVNAAVFLLTANMGQLVAAGALRLGQLVGLITGSYALVAAEITLAGATSTLTAAVWGLLMALGPIGWIVLAISVAFIAWKSGLLDWLGVADEAEGTMADLGATLGWLGQGVMLLVDTFMLLLKVGIGAYIDYLKWQFEMLVGVITWVVDMVVGYYQWLWDMFVLLFTDPGELLNRATQLGADIVSAIVDGILGVGGAIADAIMDQVPNLGIEFGYRAGGPGPGGGPDPSTPTNATAGGGTPTQQTTVDQTVNNEFNGVTEPEEIAEEVEDSTPEPEETRKEVERELERGKRGG